MSVSNVFCWKTFASTDVANGKIMVTIHHEAHEEHEVLNIRAQDIWFCFLAIQAQVPDALWSQNQSLVY